MVRQGSRILLLALALCLSACGVRSRSYGPAPSFSLKTLEGSEISSADCDGKVCVLAIWASWCAPCRTEIPILNELTREFEHEVLVVGVAVDEDRAELKEFLDLRRPKYPVVLGTAKFLADIGFSGSLPTTVFVGPDGQIQSRITGVRPKEFFLNEVRRMLEAPKTASLRPGPSEFVGR